jgi:hypothetical protein
VKSVSENGGNQSNDDHQASSHDDELNQDADMTENSYEIQDVVSKKDAD